MPLPTDKNVEGILEWMVGADETLAQARAMHTAKKEGLKIVEALCLKESEAKTASERAADAKASPRYAGALKELVDAEQAKILIELKYKRGELVIEVWRTLSANVRRTS